jgi:hypothetical protein
LNESILEVGQGQWKVEKLKKKSILLSECYVIAATKRNDTFFIVEINTKESTMFICSTQKEVEDWMSVCIVNGAHSSHFSV